MKPTDIQKDVCDFLIQQISWWRDTNDISSPTHYADLEDCIEAALEDKLSEKEIDELIDKIVELFEMIKFLSV